MKNIGKGPICSLENPRLSQVQMAQAARWREEISGTGLSQWHRPNEEIYKTWNRWIFQGVLGQLKHQTHQQTLQQAEFNM